jgi:hypothetical protein
MANGNGNGITPVKAAEIMEAVIARGDLAELTPQERGRYYARVCESVGLNPMTRPFEYLTLNGRLILYARKDCTDQLRKIHKVSVTDLIESEREGVFVVTAKVVNADGRTDAAKGAVNISKLQGDALANALMKAETKAKRRATLSICGLGFLDETEVEDIPQGARPDTLPKKDARPIYSKLQAEVDAEQTAEGLAEWREASAERIKVLPHDWQTILRQRIEERAADLGRREAADHDADGVVIEPPAAPAPNGASKGAHPLDIPEYLDRRPKPAANVEVVDEAAWLDRLQGALSGCADMESLTRAMRATMKPQRGKVSAQTWTHAELIASKEMHRIAQAAALNVLDAG